MPMYEFQCADCNIFFEELLPASDETSPTCPRCSKNEQVKRIPSGCSIKTRAASPLDRGIGPMRPPKPAGGFGGCGGGGGGFS